MKHAFLNIKYSLGVLAVLFLAGNLSYAQVIDRTARGTTPGALNFGILLFRQDLGGAYNGVGGSYTSGYREITWDDLPDNKAYPIGLPEEYYNKTSPRGAVISPVHQTVQAIIASARSSTGYQPLFQNYHQGFMAYSGERILGTKYVPRIEITFRIPGTDIPASVS